MIPLATRIPLAPSSLARETSFAVTIPAPQSSFVEFFAIFTALVEFTISCGFSVDTALPVPINSGGSIAINVGFSLAYFFTSLTFLTQIIDFNFNFFNLFTRFLISFSEILCSL